MNATRWYVSTAIVGVLIIAAPRDAVRAAQCCGDCNSNGAVSIDELVTAVNAGLGGCVLPLDFRQPFLDSADVQSCTAQLLADGFTAGEVETTAAIDSTCNTSTCGGSLLAVQHFASNRADGRGKSIVAVVTFSVSGGGAPSVQVVNIPPFNACAP